MAVKLYFSNKLDALIAQMSADLAGLKTGVFNKELIVTQTDGMQHWVSMQLAKENNIFANFEFKKPNDIILHVAQLAKITAHYAMSTEKIKWIIYFLLADDEFATKFPNVSQYFKSVDNAEVKRMQLSIKIADLFDQMVIYRPAYIKAWNENVLLNADDETEQWQAFLWSKMREKLDNPLDRTQLKDKLIAQLNVDSELQSMLKQTLPTISVFGLSIITQYHIEFFYEVSKYVDVHFYFLNPAPEQYWFDYKSEKEIQRLKHKFKNLNTGALLVGNDLLTNWGKIGQDLFAELLAIDEFANASESLVTEEPERNTLLNIIKNDIFNNIPPNERLQIETKYLNDNSLQIVSCHTEAREVEVLYNFLIKTMSENADIAPHDILIMVPNIENYSPFIQSVFDNAPYKLPYALADRDLQQSDELIAVLFSLLELNSYEFTSEKILQLIDYKIITNKYNLTNPSLIRRVVNDVNIRFGWGNEAENETETNLVSWQSGIERIVLGIAMNGGEMYDYHQKTTLCYDALEGSEATEMLNFIVFLKAIQGLIMDGVQARTLSDWRLYIKQIAEKLLDENTEHEGLTQVLNRMDYIIELEELLDSEIPRNVFMQSISSVLNANATNTGYLRGNITFCSTLPMRSIPFKVIALLGMNSNDFPRQEIPLGFDLMAKKPQKGDRNGKANDKYLFLEALLSTENIFYLSYKGRSTKDNSHKEPSVLVEELLNYVQQQSAVDDVKTLLVTEHPLHGFSEKYFVDSDSKLYSYFDYSAAKNTIAFNEKEAENSFETNITIQQFIAAISKPIQYYFNKVLGIYYREDNLLVPENEVFEIDNLQKNAFKNELIQREITPEFILQQKQKGNIPLANMGKVALNIIENEISEYKSYFHSLTENCVVSSVHGNLQLEQISIDYSLPVYLADNVCKQVLVSYSSDYANAALGAWLKHLILVADKQLVQTNLICQKDKEAFLYSTSFDNQLQAIELLKTYEKAYLTIVQKLQLLVHKSSFEEWQKQQGKEDASPEKLLEKIQASLKTERGALAYDTYLQTLQSLGVLDEMMNEELIALMDEIYTPMNEYFLKNN